MIEFIGKSILSWMNKKYWPKFTASLSVCISMRKCCSNQLNQLKPLAPSINRKHWMRLTVEKKIYSQSQRILFSLIYSTTGIQKKMFCQRKRNRLGSLLFELYYWKRQIYSTLLSSLYIIYANRHNVLLTNLLYFKLIY